MALAKSKTHGQTKPSGKGRLFHAILPREGCYHVQGAPSRFDVDGVAIAGLSTDQGYPDLGAHGRHGLVELTRCSTGESGWWTTASWQ